MNAERVFVGLGANLGDARATVSWAAQALTQMPGSTRVALSGIWRSAPVDAGGPDFINAVAELRCALQPHQLLLELQALEAQQGRERPFRNAPRTLDLDLLLFGAREIDTPDLTVPHPRMHRRAFVLLPLLELAPDLAHPRLGRLSDWVAATADQAIDRLP